MNFRIFNSLKQPANRRVQGGDWITVQDSGKIIPVCLNIIEIYNNHECDSSEKCIKLMFQEFSSMNLSSSVFSGIKDFVLKRRQNFIKVKLTKKEKVLLAYQKHQLVARYRVAIKRQTVN